MNREHEKDGYLANRIITELTDKVSSLQIKLDQAMRASDGWKSMYGRERADNVELRNKIETARKSLI